VQIISVGCHWDTANVCLWYKIIIMKKALKIKFGYGALLICLVVLGASCKKITPELPDVSNSPYYMRFKANGVFKNYQMPANNIHDSVTITGKKIYGFQAGAANSTFESLVIIVWSDSFVVSNKYKETDLVFGYQPKAFIGYQVPGSLGYISYGLYDPQTLAKYRNSVITIASISNKEVKGSFSGTVYQQNSSGDLYLKDSLQITNGEFYLPVK
jgi:hypothetical protein